MKFSTKISAGLLSPNAPGQLFKIMSEKLLQTLLFHGFLGAGVREHRSSFFWPHPCCHFRNGGRWDCSEEPSPNFITPPIFTVVFFSFRWVWFRYFCHDSLGLHISFKAYYCGCLDWPFYILGKLLSVSFFDCDEIPTCLLNDAEILYGEYISGQPSLPFVTNLVVVLDSHFSFSDGCGIKMVSPLAFGSYCLSIDGPYPSSP